MGLQMTTPESIQNNINALIVGNGLMMNELMNSTVTPMGPMDDEDEDDEDDMSRDYDDLIEGDAETARPNDDQDDAQQDEETEDEDVLSEVNMMHTPMGPDDGNQDVQHLPVLSDEGTSSNSDAGSDDDDDYVVTKGKTEEYKHVKSDEFIIVDDDDDENENEIVGTVGKQNELGIWQAYIDKFGNAPSNSSQLQMFSKTSKKFKPLKF